MRKLLALFVLAAGVFAGPVEDAADKVLAAVKAKQDLKALASKDEPDPWLVVDALCARREFDAALAFAKAAPRPDVERLPAYVASCRRKRPNATTLRAYGEAAAAFGKKDTNSALAIIGRQPVSVDHAFGIRTLHLKALVLRALGRLEESGTQLASVADAAHAIGWWARESLATYQGASIAHRRADRAGTVRFAMRHLEIERKRGSKPGIARALHVAGLALSNAGRPKEGLATYAQSLELSREIGDRMQMAHTIGNMGLVHGRQGAHAKALEHFERAFVIAREIGDRNHESGTLINIGIELESLGSYDEARTRLLEGLEIARQIGNRRWQSNALGSLADVSTEMGDMLGGLAYEQQALALAVENGDRFGAALSHIGIGSSYRDLGSLGQAVASHRRALELAEEMSDRYAMSLALYNLGADYIDLGSYAEALAAHERALQLCEELGDRSGLASGLQELSMIRRDLGQLDAAMADLQRALALHEKLGEHGGIASSLLAMGRMYIASDEWEKARDSFERSRARFEELKAPDGVAHALAGLGQSQRMLGAHEEAERAFSRAFEIHERLGNRSSMAYDLRLQALVHEDRGELDQANTLLERAVELGGKVGSPRVDADMRSALARNHLLRGDPEKAIIEARRAVERLPFVVSGLGEEQGAGLRQELSRVFAIGAAAAVQLDRPDDACFFLEAGRAGSLLEGLGGRKALYEAAIPSGLRDKEARVRDRERVAQWKYGQALKSGKEVEARWSALEKARDEVAAMASRIRREAKAQADLLYPEAASLQKIRRELRRGEVLVLYATLVQEAFALVVRREESRIVKLGGTESILKACEALQRAVARPDQRGMRAPPHERAPFLIRRLREMLVDPLRLGDETKRLLVSPDGLLGYVPFVALTEREVVYVPSGTTYRLLRGEADLRGRKVLAIGDAVGADLAPLPESGKEAKAVGDLILLGDDASSSHLRKLLSGAERLRAVHFACHGVVDPQRPVLSELALTGEPLRCLDIYRMKIPADLVVLSACETGKGKVYKAEGVIGWTRAFMFAGAPRVIVSLWKVDDAATRALMEKFYELWKPGKVPTATALKRAQEHVASQPQWKHPYFWAAWQLWGLGE